MRNNLLTGFIVIGFLAILGAVSINAQTNLTGKYRNIETIADEESGEIDWTLEVKSKNIAVLTSIEGNTKEVKRGSWKWNKAQNSMTATFPARNKKEIKFTYVFSLSGKNLVLKKMLTSEGEGETYGERVFEKQ